MELWLWIGTRLPLILRLLALKNNSRKAMSRLKSKEAAYLIGTFTVMFIFIAFD